MSGHCNGLVDSLDPRAGKSAVSGRRCGSGARADRASSRRRRAARHARRAGYDGSENVDVGTMRARDRTNVSRHLRGGSMRNRLGALLAVSLLAVVPAPSAHRASPVRPISLVINGDRLSLEPPARIEHGLLLVPVRRTIEALGLVFMRHGGQIVTQVASKTISLTLGSRIADIDGSSVVLDSPPVDIDNVLYAPLRYFTSVLGAQAIFDRKAAQVTIVAQLVGRSGTGVIADGATLERIGTVSAVDLN